MEVKEGKSSRTRSPKYESLHHLANYGRTSSPYVMLKFFLQQVRVTDDFPNLVSTEFVPCFCVSIFYSRIGDLTSYGVEYFIIIIVTIVTNMERYVAEHVSDQQRVVADDSSGWSLIL